MLNLTNNLKHILIVLKYDQSLIHFTNFIN